MWETKTITGRAQVPLVSAGDGPTLISNADANNTIYLSDDYGAQVGGANVVALPPNGWVAVNGEGDVYGVCAQGQTANALVIPGGVSFFQLVEIITKTIIINAAINNGLFVYSPTEAAGNLYDSITPGPNTGLAPTGDTTYPGFTAYGTAAQANAGFIGQLWSAAVWFFDTNFFPQNKAHVSIGAVGAATQELFMTSGNVSTDKAAAIGLISSATPEILMTLNAITILDLLAAGSVINSNFQVIGQLLVTTLRINNPFSTAAIEVGQNYAATAAHLGFWVAGDTAPDYRFQIDGNGKIQWSSGAAGPDTDLYRDAGGSRLVTDQAFLAIQAIETEADYIVFQAGSTNTAFVVQAIGQPNPQFLIDCNGKHLWGVGGGTATDTDLFRQAVNTLATDSILSLKVAGSAPPAISGYQEIVGSGANLPFTTGASGQGWFIGGAALADFTQNSVVSVALTAFGKSWAIDANDASTSGDGYEFDFQIIGKQGSTAQSLTLGWQLNGTSIGTISFPASFAPINAVFLARGKLFIDIVTGNSATGAYYWHMSALGSAAGGTQTPAGGGPTGTGTNAINTTVVNTVQFEAGWSSITGSPTMTSIVTRMRKVA